MARRLTKREGRIFIICLVLVFFYGGYYGLVSPLLNKISETDQFIEVKSRRVKKDKRSLRDSQALINEYEAYRKQFKQAGSNEEVMSSLISEIEKVAVELGIPIADTKPKRVKKEKYFNRFSLSLTLEGELPKITQFLHCLQDNTHLFKVEEVHFEKGSRGQSEIIKANLVVGKIFLP